MMLDKKEKRLFYRCYKLNIVNVFSQSDIGSNYLLPADAFYLILYLWEL